jgi:hypothetical protein
MFQSKEEWLREKFLEDRSCSISCADDYEDFNRTIERISDDHDGRLPDDITLHDVYRVQIDNEIITNYSDVAVVNNQGSYMKVFSQVLGQVKADELELSVGTTVGMLKTKLNLANTFIAKVSGLDANDNTELKEWSVVLWSEKTKGN